MQSIYSLYLYLYVFTENWRFFGFWGGCGVFCGVGGISSCTQGVWCLVNTALSLDTNDFDNWNSPCYLKALYLKYYAVSPGISCNHRHVGYFLICVFFLIHTVVSEWVKVTPINWQLSVIFILVSDILASRWICYYRAIHNTLWKQWNVMLWDCNSKSLLIIKDMLLQMQGNQVSN